MKRLRNPSSGFHPRNIYKKFCKSRLFDHYISETDLSLNNSSQHIVFPEVFSFIENPNSTLKVIEEIIKSAQQNINGALTFDQSKIKTLDFCAEAVATAIAKEASYKLRTYLRGIYPADDELKEIIKATGLPNALGVSIPNSDDQFITFPLKHGRKEVTYEYSMSEQRDKLVGDFIEYVNKCFRIHKFELNEDGIDYLGSILTEILENAENHSGQKDWWLAGYMRNTGNKHFSYFHIALFNFGKSIYESLQGLPKSALLRKELDRLSNKHLKLFGHWSKEQLWTLYALQSGVSRNNSDKDEIGHNGKGTVDIINFFQTLGQSGVAGIVPKMCLISGNTYILHDCVYKMKEVTTKHGEKRMRLAFNKDNDLEKPPDKAKLQKLKYRFPGTLFSFRFYLNKEFVYKIVQNGS